MEGGNIVAEWVQKLIQKCVPPTRRFVNRRINELLDEIQNKIDSINLEDINNEIRNASRINEEQIKNLTKLTQDNDSTYKSEHSEIRKDIKNKLSEIYEIKESVRILEELKRSIQQIEEKQNYILELIKTQDSRISDLQKNIIDVTSEMTIVQKNQTNKFTLLEKVEEENTWANVFHDVIKDSVWLQNKAFAPGRWAAGYQMLYVMYRILDSTRPKRILELGLGQTTRMISQYSIFYNAEHQVVENDPKWIEFFATTYEVPDNVKIINLNTIVDKYLDDEAVIMYRGFEEQFRGQKFDFICIDAPLGGKAIKYARVDVLKILPECLEREFVIIIDDTERIGEINTIELIQKTFKENGIQYVMKRYDGRKSSTIFTTKKYSFLTSL